MKYWRGYLVGAILLAFTLGFRQIAEANSKLVDMIYPYVTRMVQNFMTNWSSSAPFCVWQAILVALAIGVLASIVLMAIFRWNPIQWFGWVVALACAIVLLHTGIYGMNEFAGPIAEDMRLPETEFTQTQIEEAAAYYRDQANELAETVIRNSDGTLVLPELSQLNEQAANGFKHLVYDDYYSVFAGSTAPVKELGMADYFTEKGEIGLTVAITGEAAVNMQAPTVMIPYAVCREMCYRMCIATAPDTAYAGFMACQANEDPLFRYAGYVMAYHYLLEALPESAANAVTAYDNARLRSDVQTWEAFASRGITEKNALENEQVYADVARLLVSWHYLDVVLPSITEPEVQFDPMDETLVDLTGLPNIPDPTETTEEAA